MLRSEYDGQINVRTAVAALYAAYNIRFNVNAELKQLSSTVVCFDSGGT